MNSYNSIVDNVLVNKEISYDDFCILMDNRNEEAAKYLHKKAREVADQIYGKEIFTRGLIEFTNYCKNNCLYCGIRRDNKNIHRYRLTKEEILSCTDEGHELGFRTFVLQGGEDAYYTDDVICDIISSIKEKYSDCAITLSIGEKAKESYKAYFDAGAERYLLRHETADENHYKKLHADGQSFKNRMRCLQDLMDIGYQVGCGFMVGSPYQTNDSLYKDIMFIKEFKPHMVGIGPFISHHDTPFRNQPSGSLNTTLTLLSIIRLIHPEVLLPATTALGTIDSQGREKGILAGANVVMPNLSPIEVRGDYLLYDNKICTGEESAQCRSCLEKRMEGIGYQAVVSRGDSLVTVNK